MKREGQGGGPMQVELKVGVMSSAGMESVVVDEDWGWISWITSGERAWISIY